MSRIALFTAVGLLAHAATLAAADLPPEKIAAAQKALDTNCGRCHGSAGANNAGGGFDWLFDTKRLIEKKTLVVGQGDASKLIKKMVSKDMPPEGENPRPTEADIAAVKEWINAGAPSFEAKPSAAPERKFITDEAVMGTILGYLNSPAVQPQDQRYMRFFTMHHLYNNKSVSEEDLHWFRAAMSKVANSLSWHNRIYVPPAIDEYGTLFAVDVRKYDWDRKDLPFWLAMTRLYPYGLSYDAHANQQLQRNASMIYQMTGSKLPFLRADWFIAVATRPPLYHVALQIPKHAYDLEKRLGVNVIENIMNNKVHRAGFQKSGVSSQNRLVERHDSNTGMYYKSYDFLKDNGKGNLLAFPLGPKFAKNPYPELAFQHDGGEMIFNLPNGLQGYMLVKGDDTRINAGPTEVVSDPGKISGKIEIVNGVSCIGCHNKGIYPFPNEDDVRNGAIGLQGQPRQKLYDLYRDPKEIKALMEEDEARFVTALGKATNPFLKLANKTVEDAVLAEPVKRLAGRYSRNLTLGDAASELGIPPEKFAGALQFNPNIQALGLGTWLAPGGTIARERWQTSRSGNSRLTVFQIVASELGVGDPCSETGRVDP